MVSPQRGFAPSPLRFVRWDEHAGAAGGGGRWQPAEGGWFASWSVSLQAQQWLTLNL